MKRNKNVSSDSSQTIVVYSDAASGWAWLVLAHPEFGSSVNPIPTGRADYAHPISACPPKFENLTASLESIRDKHLVSLTSRSKSVISFENQGLMAEQLI